MTGKEKIIIERELLLGLYWGNEYSTEKVAELIDCSQCAILGAMNRYNIPRRTLSEARIGKEPWNKGTHGLMPEPWNKNGSHSEITKLKISISKLKNPTRYWLGRPRPGMRGENNPRWNGGITDENKAIRHSIEYNNWRNAVYRRNNWTCQKCRYVEVVI